MMQVYGVIGWKNAGKTSLMERLVAEITARGFSVSTIKHVHHDVDLDQPGRDTWRHRAAGAVEVVLASRHRFALMAEHRGTEPELATILARLAPVDLVLVEGYKRDPHRKIEVYRREPGQPLIQPDDPLVRAVASDLPLTLPVPVLDLNDTAQVADFILRETGLGPAHAQGGHRFDRVVVVDWSASNRPTSASRKADSIWIGSIDEGGSDEHHFRTRTAAEAHLTALIHSATAAGDRLLIGFDFAFGYPAGFAQRLTGNADVRAVWAWLAHAITDAPDNRNNRFEVANTINAGLGQGGPFWSHPVTHSYAHLGPTKLGIDHATLGFAERREVELRLPSAKTVWMLNNPGAVASQSLLGLPMIHRLSQLPGVAVWPFDPPVAQVVLAEVYPSILTAEVDALVQSSGLDKDCAQVRLLAQALFTLSTSGKLGALLDVGGHPAASEEGWILGAGHAPMLKAALR